MAGMNEFQQTLTAAGARCGLWHARETILDFADPAAEFRAFREGCALVEHSERTQVELAGEDAGAFLHNLCTNDTKVLRPGGGCEVFLTNVQGKIIGHGYVYRAPAGCLYETIPSQGAALVAYFDRYLFRERVKLLDRTPEWGSLLLAGPNAAAVLSQLGCPNPPRGRLEHSLVELKGQTCALRRVDFVGGDCWQLSVPRAALQVLWQACLAAGATPCGTAAFDQARILHGTPSFGFDITDENLPQEVARDKRAISFTKGCYIGQETVARIDALGHVNKTLCGLKISSSEDNSPAPPPGVELYAEADTQSTKPLAKLTSVAAAPATPGGEGVSPTHIALGYVRRGSNAPGQKLVGAGFSAEVVSLPFGE